MAGWLGGLAIASSVWMAFPVSTASRIAGDAAAQAIPPAPAPSISDAPSASAAVPERIAARRKVATGTSASEARSRSRAADARKPRASSAPRRGRRVTRYIDTQGYAGANLRARPGTRHRILLTMPYGAQVRAAAKPVRGPDGGDWYKVTYRSRTGYTLGLLLGDRKPPPAPRAASRPAPRPVAKPARLVIDTPGVRVDAPVEYLGLTPSRAMETPRGWWNVGWYELGPVPGQRGNAVIAGHLDSTTGPAAFWNLRYLRIGDLVSVVSTDGKVVRFRVSRMVVYYVDQMPMQEIFGPSSGSHLNLYTCEGYFDRGAGQYDRRLVVYTDKIA